MTAVFTVVMEQFPVHLFNKTKVAVKNKTQLLTMAINNAGFSG